MKYKTIKNIRICCSIAFILCVLWTLLTAFHFIGLINGWGGVSEKVVWTENNSIKLAFFSAYLLSAIALIGLCIKIIINTLVGIRESNTFPQQNVKPLFWLAFASFAYLFCWTNQHILRGTMAIHLQGANFILPFLLLFFAFMYKIAADAVEENNLTI